jgi:CheY-like chemotaxis protein
LRQLSVLNKERALEAARVKKSTLLQQALARHSAYRRTGACPIAGPHAVWESVPYQTNDKTKMPHPMHQLTIDLPTPVKKSPRARLLVVDDDPLIREFHAAVLRMDGYEVATAKDGVAALELLAEERFDLVLTERHMPKFDGASIVLALRSAGSRIPMIMVSGSLADPPLPPEIVREISVAIPKLARTAEVLSAVAGALSPAPPRAGKPVPCSEGPTFGRLTNRNENRSNSP